MTKGVFLSDQEYDTLLYKNNSLKNEVEELKDIIVLLSGKDYLTKPEPKESYEGNTLELYEYKSNRDTEIKRLVKNFREVKEEEIIKRYNNLFIHPTNY